MIFPNKTALLMTLAFGGMEIASANKGLDDPRSLESEPNNCYDYGTNCRGCLTDGCKFDGTSCIPDCSHTDGPCYDVGFFPGLNILGTCRRAKNHCFDFGTNCRGCLREGCKFDGETCMPSCDYNMDGSCYEVGTFPGLDLLGTCRRAKEQSTNKVEPRAVGLVKQTQPFVDIASTTESKPSAMVAESTTLTEVMYTSEPEVSYTSEPFICSEALDCRDCLENGCAFGMGECIDSCDQVADASCYSEAVFPWMNRREICRKEWTERRDWELCSGASDCGACTSTSLYGGEGNCFWHDEVKVCKPTLSDAWSVGTDMCFSDRREQQCYDAGRAGRCNSCLDSDCAWTGDQCVSSCDVIADADCWSNDVFPSLGANSICKLAKVEDEDENLCSVQTDCFECTDTHLFDGVNSCQWYYDAQTGNEWCGTGGCDMWGNCGSDWCTMEAELEPASEEFVTVEISKSEKQPEQTMTTTEKAVKVMISEDERPCLMMTNCLSCLENDSECAWIAGSCQESCDAIADAACYSEATFPQMEEKEICQMAGSTPEEIFDATDSIDESLPCQNMTNCLTCMDNANHCAWVQGSCQADCSGVEDAACYKESLFPRLEEEQICRLAGDYRTADSLDETDSSSIEETMPCLNMTNCLSCLENDNNCAWAMDSCQESCDVIQDASCYADINFPELEEQQICRIAEENSINFQLCNNSTACDDCTNNKMLDGSSCSWFTAEYDSSVAWCAPGGCDMWGNCGSTTCDAPTNAGTIRGSSQHKAHKGRFDWLPFP